MKKLVLGKHVAPQKTGSLRYMTGLRELTISTDAFTSMADLFSGSDICLASLNITSGQKKLADGALKGCTKLDNLSLDAPFTTLSALFGTTPTWLVNLTLDSSISSVKSEACKGCTGLTSVYIPSSVTGIGNSAFSGCSGLLSVELPASIERIGDGAFSGCNQLAYINLPSSLTSIGSYILFNTFNVEEFDIDSPAFTNFDNLIGQGVFFV